MSPDAASNRITSLLQTALESQNWSALRQAEQVARQAMEALPAGPEPPVAERDIKRVQILSGFRQLPTDNAWWPERVELLKEARQWLTQA